MLEMKYTNQKLVEAYTSGLQLGKGNNLEIDERALYSYDTPIALRCEDGYILNYKKYSQTTSVHQGRLRRVLGMSGEKIIEVDEIMLRKCIDNDIRLIFDIVELRLRGSI